MYQFDLDDQFQRKAFEQYLKAEIDRFCEQHYKQGRSHRLAVSQLARECSREIWYKFRWAKEGQKEARMLRLFERGNLQEPRFVTWLEGAGFTIIEVDPSAGVDRLNPQWRMRAVQEHAGGFLDGIGAHALVKQPLLLEFKSYNTKKFVKLANTDKSISLHNSEHWGQMCSYGKEYDLRYAVYCAINKNDDDVYIEVAKLDWALGADLLIKAEAIVNAKEPPLRISDNAGFFKCSYCDFKGVCHYNDAPDRNCRTCRNAEPVEGGQWRCNAWNEVIPRDFILKAAEKCPHYYAIG